MFSEVNAMLLQFRVKNYRSIGDEVVIDFTAGSGKEHSDFLIERNKVKILPVVSLYGSNASGKSNIVRAMMNMFEHIMNSHMYGEKYGTLTTPFSYDESLHSQPSEFEMFIALDDKEYQYGFIAKANEILEEWLYQRKLSTNTTIWTPVFEREADEVQFAEKKEYEKLSDLADVIGKKTLILSFLANHSKSKAIIFRNIYGWAGGIFRWNLDYIDTNAWSGVYKDIDGAKESLESFTKFLHEFDSSIERFDIKEERNKDGKIELKVFTYHNGKAFPIEIESHGTQKLFRLYTALYFCWTVQPSVLIYDELDSYIHPLILRRIVGMFHDKEVNKMGSQLVFTSHNLIVLDNRELRRDEIWFVEKDERGFTNAYSLDSFDTDEGKIRSDVSYGKHYLAGRFGAIPYVDQRR